MNQNLFQLLIIILAIGLPALGQIWKKLDEKRAENKARQEIERRKLEMLRTGRAVPGEGGEPQSTQASAQAALAAQRQARLQELRKRQQLRLQQAAAQRSQGPAAGAAGPVGMGAAGGAAAFGSATATPTAPRRAPAPRPPTSPVPRPSPGQQTPSRQPTPVARSQSQSQPLPAARSAPQRAPVARPLPSRPISDRQISPGRGLGRVQPAQDVPMSGLSSSGPSMSSLSSVGTGAGMGMGAGVTGSAYDIRDRSAPRRILGTTMTHQDWRRAILLHEIMGPPVSLRRPDQGNEA
ncbi:MAG: hypothetical protein ACF8SC_08940 [Phycisphaerales bacterium JB037]